MLHRVHGIALAQIGRHEAARDALETSLREARGRGEEFEIALTLDALCALSERDGDVDHAGRSERDAIVARLDIVGLPPVALDRRPEAPRRRRRAAAGGDARAQ
jgi:hypothetical protein